MVTLRIFLSCIFNCCYIYEQVNKQITINRQNSKAQTRVVSLLQSNSSVLKSSTSTATSATSKSTSPNTVLVKLSSGTGAPQVVNKKVSRF